MKVHAIWLVILPLQFMVGNRFSHKELSLFSFEIDSVKIELLKKKSDANLIDRIRIDLFEEYDDNYFPPHEHHEYLSNFTNLLTYKAGLASQKFLDGFSRNTDDENHQIFDGDDFLTEYDFHIEPSILTGSANSGEGSYYLDDEILTKSVSFANKRKGVLDNSWYLIRDAEHSMELGKYEISLIYMAIEIELLITSALNGFLKDNGKFKSKKHEEKIKSLFGEKASFVDRYFSYGLSLLTDKKISDEVLPYIVFIYKLRNKLAHGKQLFEIELLKENGINELNIRDYLRDFINNVTEAHNFFFDLNVELKMWK